MEKTKCVELVLDVVSCGIVTCFSLQSSYEKKYSIKNGPFFFFQYIVHE